MFVVLEVAGGSSTALSAHTTNGKRKFVAVVVPEGAPIGTEDFFAEGEKLQHEATPMRSLGVYVSESDALAAAKLKSKDIPTTSWHRLTPHELLRLVAD